MYRSVFLNTFPFGTGITSSEAIAVCIPVIVYPEQTSVLHFSLAQIRAISDEHGDLEQLLSVHSIEEYVKRAVEIANMPIHESRVLSETLCKRRSQLFGIDGADEAAKEWAAFIYKVSASFRSGGVEQ